MIYETSLEPIFDSQKSFYGKAKVREINGIVILRSYDTDVAAIDNDGEFHRLWGGDYFLKHYGMYGDYEEWRDWSPTTGKHIREFAKQNGFADFKKADYMKLEVETIHEILAADTVKKIQEVVDAEITAEIA